ncbi:MAG: hypothetical protein VXZ39_01145 [Planctomycetota bacterium]|nr:hypothetical protein [Planctomycetota bacterium]
MSGTEGATFRVRAGLDEAGYGPLLGPLTIGYSAFRCAAGRDVDWPRLDAAVTAEPRSDATHIVVADSKKVFTRNPRGERRLETAALTFLRAAGRDVDSGLDLVAAAPCGLAPDGALLARHPWYGELPASLPHRVSAEELATRSSKLDATLGDAGVEVADAGVVVVPAGALNDSFANTSNKGATLWSFNSGVIAHLFERFGDEGLDLTVDRLGGRARYGRQLSALIPFSVVRVVAESSFESRYLVEAQGRTMAIRFVQKGDRDSLPVALASCLAKYARELDMGAFNEHFGALYPAVAPTAGYVTDARRWLNVVSQERPDALPNRDDLVRSR